jgi:hypothetical protein
VFFKILILLFFKRVVRLKFLYTNLVILSAFVAFLFATKTLRHKVTQRNQYYIIYQSINIISKNIKCIFIISLIVNRTIRYFLKYVV